MLGDLNAKVGSDNTSFETAMTKNYIGKINDNRELFADLPFFNKLVIELEVVFSPPRRQDNVRFSGQQHRKPDWLHLHSIQVHKIFVVLR